jgi:hypothetical protein
MIAVLSASGCISVKAKMGAQSDVEALQELKIGETTASEAVQIMGYPSGAGRSLLPFQAEPVDMWQYFYAEAKMEDVRYKILFLYFHEDVYQGYLWWSSFE